MQLACTSGFFIVFLLLFPGQIVPLYIKNHTTHQDGQDAILLNKIYKTSKNLYKKTLKTHLKTPKNQPKKLKKQVFPNFSPTIPNYSPTIPQLFSKNSLGIPYAAGVHFCLFHSIFAVLPVSNRATLHKKSHNTLGRTGRNTAHTTIHSTLSQ